MKNTWFNIEKTQWLSLEWLTTFLWIATGSIINRKIHLTKSNCFVIQSFLQIFWAYWTYIASKFTTDPAIRWKFSLLLGKLRFEYLRTTCECRLFLLRINSCYTISLFIQPLWFYIYFIFFMKSNPNILCNVIDKPVQFMYL